MDITGSHHEARTQDNVRDARIDKLLWASFQSGGERL